MVDVHGASTFLVATHRQMVDGFVRSLGSGVFAVAMVFPVGDFRRSRIFSVTAPKDQRPAHTPYQSLWTTGLPPRLSCDFPIPESLAIAVGGQAGKVDRRGLAVDRLSDEVAGDGC